MDKEEKLKLVTMFTQCLIRISALEKLLIDNGVLSLDELKKQNFKYEKEGIEAILNNALPNQ